jgi:uncharacterized protein YfaS (alpha-2-macroglobulin family)/tetratricopeptide (TPR) repeat protein
MKPVRSCAALAVIAIVALQCGLLVAAEPATADVPLVDEKIRELMQDRDYPGAIKAVEQAVGVEGAPQDYLTYLKGRALFLQKQYDQAVATFEELEKQFPDSPWLRRARFGKAVALARKGDFRSAELIYRAEAEHLLSPDRKQEIADIYLEFADAYFKPPKEEQKPDYQKALDFYTKALAVGPKPEKAAECELLVAQCQQQLGKLDEAAKLYQKFTEDHPDNALDVEARFRLAECQLAKGQLKEARRTWQDLLAKHTDSQSERIAEAAFRLSRTWRVPEPQDDQELSLGVAALESFLKRFPAHKLASQAHLDMARSYMHRGRHEDAASSLKRFLADQRYQDREEVPEARRLLGRSYQLQKKFAEALDTWKDYLAKHPAHKAWSEVQKEIINTEYLMGSEKYKAEQYEDARKLWSEFLAKYPLEGRNPQILFDFGQMHYQQKKWQEAITDWRRLVSKYPETNPSSRGQYMIAATLEEKLGKLDDALEEYRKVTWGSHANHAKQAIARLTAKSLSVATERVFRSDETPAVELVTRNIEKVTVRAYTVDMETYFRKMHLARGVEQLDIALIDPDKTFEFDVPKYAQYQQLESTIEVPLPQDVHSGVMAVTVSSETLEATTMLLASDLDMIVKSSRDEVFVFTQNMLTGKPWPGAKLLISDGKNVFAEAKTGDDGVFQRSYEELKKAGDVRVFAIADGNVASNVVGLKGVGVARGLADKGYIYTDRPAYRAGQIVHLRGCLRHAVDDAYTVEEAKKYTLEVFDGRNRLVRQQEVALNKFGTFHAHFVLPPTSPQGEYRVLVRDQDQKSYQGTFQVHQYQLEPVRLVIDTPRTVYYRGEDIEGTIRAEYYYGAPLVNAEIRYVLAGERVHTARTDDNGKVKFKLPTREFRETQTLPLVVTLPERNLQRASNFLLACQGFSIALDTVRSVYVAGETFEVSISTRDAEGKPAGRELALKVFEQTTVQGKVGERMVETHELESSADDGTARQTLKLEQGGRYVLRAEGTDRFDNPVSGQHIVQISDEDDQVRLRILADAHTFKVGDTARVKLHWRENPALALVTYQGARVLQYQLIELNKGSNPLEIPMTARLAPNFELAVAVMTDGRKAEGGRRKGEEGKRFHEANSPFTVERELNVTIASKPKKDADGSVRPGEDLEVTVTTTDPQGNPVSAEVGLAMVEQALLERFPSPIAAIQDFFRGQPRQTAVRTTSSITFEYRPSTRPINRRLLAELERLEITAEEEESRVTDLAATVVEAAPAETMEEDAFGSVAFGEARAPALGGESRSTVRRYFGGIAGQGGAAGFAGRQSNASQQLQRGAGVAFGRRGELGVEDAKIIAGARFQFDSDFSGPVSAEQMEGLDVVVLSGKKVDVATVRGIVEDFEKLNQSQVVLLDDSGGMKNVNLLANGRWGIAAAERFVEELGEEGAVLLPNLGPQETGYWNPSIVTGEDGKATVTFTVPDRSTAWKLLAKGITTETLAGEGTGELVVKKELFGQLKLPMAFTDGDEASVEASVHNNAIEQGQIEVTLKTTIGERTVEEKKTLEVSGKGIHELVFKTKLSRPEQAEAGEGSPQVSVMFELIVAAGDQRDVVHRAIPLEPFGMPVYAAASGSATSDTTAWVESPEGMSLQSPSLQILVGPTVEQSLLDIVLGPAPPCQIANTRIASGMESTTSDLMASLGLQKLVGGSREAGGPQVQALDGRIRSAISLLISSQNDDGAWSWTGRGGGSNGYSTARAVWAMGLARKAGYTVPEETFNKALGFLRNLVAATANSDYESHAILLHALSVAGKGDFALANRLYRSRPNLSAGALAYLALAFAEMDRKPTAGELLSLLGERNLDDSATRRKVAVGSLPWSHAPAELRALYARGLQKVNPQDPKLKELVDWLLAHRTGHRWAPDKATGPAALALCDWFAKSRFEGDRYKLAVFVNDVQAKELDVDPAAGTQTIDVPASLLTEGKQRINFQITGRGRYSYQCILGGLVPADKLVSTTDDWRVTRTYEPAPLELDGQEIPRGFDVLQGSYSSFRNPLTQLPVGRRGIVELEIYRQHITSNTPESQLEYLVVTEPIPCGTTVIEKSVTGPFERFEISPGAITFYIGSRRRVGRIRYELYGYLPGQYRAGPTVLRNAHRPDQLAVTKLKPLGVLALGRQSSDKYRLTPKELYELGNRHFDKGDLKTAQGHLADLVQNWNLKPDVYKHSVQMLLDVHLDLGPASQVVHYFEIVKEKWPAEEIPFQKIVKVGAAYHEMGEYERSYLIFRATVESSFRRESGVAGFLDDQGEFTRSVDVMGRLLREYPPEAYIAAATYALAQRVYAKAPEAAGDPKLREEKINRVNLVQRAWRMLQAFLTAYPEDPAADQAAFSTANALLELKKYEEASAACNRYAQRYPESDLLDSYWYMIGYCHFAAGEHQAALQMCRKVAEAKRTDKKTGREVESPNKWQAVYILGQVHHSLGQAADAIRQYDRVKDRFADAEEAIEYFSRKAIELPEVTTVKPGEPAHVELEFRNIASCDAKVYRIDLMKFSLLKQDLGGITKINLAGIRPYHEATVTLGDGKDYRDRIHKIELPLKEEGAYLVVCRGENLHTSGLVLVTPLAVEVQEDVASGRVRTTVKDLTAEKYLNEVHVKVIGSRNDDFVSGETDLRGVFIADGIQGTSTVIAQADPTLYAFFRGTTELVPQPAAGKPAAAEQGKEPAAAPPAKAKADLLEGLQRANTVLQQKQVELLQETYQSDDEGVEAQEAF